MTDDQMPARPAVAHADGPQRPAEGTERGEAPGGAEGPSLTDLVGLDPNLTGGLDAAEYVQRRNCDHGPRLDDLEREINLVDRILARHGFRREHGHHGARGVAWLAERYDGAVEELADIDRELIAMTAERDGLRGKVEAVRALHRQRTAIALDGVEITFDECAHDDEFWPCPTVQAIEEARAA